MEGTDWFDWSNFFWENWQIWLNLNKFWIPNRFILKSGWLSNQSSFFFGELCPFLRLEQNIALSRYILTTYNSLAYPKRKEERVSPPALPWRTNHNFFKSRGIIKTSMFQRVISVWICRCLESPPPLTNSNPVYVTATRTLFTIRSDDVRKISFFPNVNFLKKFSTKENAFDLLYIFYNTEHIVNRTFSKIVNVQIIINRQKKAENVYYGKFVQF